MEISNEGNRPRPFWNVGAILLPPAASIGGYFIGAEPDSLKPLLYMIPACAVGSFLGSLAAIVALVRREEWQELSIFALFIDGIVFLSTLGLITEELF